MSDPTARVLQLLSLLQTHKFWPGTELSERLEVSGRTLRRDVDRLRELGYPVDAEALAILAQACRDHEELRFDYTARDGEATRRLVRPHQLVSAGRRWYLVAFDVRRDDWRTFRVDRMTEPRPARARFSPLDLPGGDAAAFVARSLGNRPFPHFATFVADGTPEQVREATQWADPEVSAVGPDRSRVTVKAEAVVELTAIGAILATRGEVTLEDASGPEVAAALAEVADRLARTVT